MTVFTLPRIPDCPVCEDLLRVRWSYVDGRMRGTGVAACPACLMSDRSPLPVFHLRPYQDIPTGGAA